MKSYVHCFIGLFTTAVLTNTVFAQSNPLEIRNLLDKWVETKQIISKEQSDWEIEKSLLSDTRALLASEVERLESELDDLKASSTASDEERTSLSSEKEALKKASEVVSSSIGNLEIKIKEILPFLPSPLIEKIRPLIRRLPDDPKNSDLSLGQRVQNIVGILSQADKFNTTITASSETRAFEEGKVVQVTTVYWGLAMAYYVDDSGEYAGIGIPTKEGWEWPLVEGIASEIKSLVDIYEGTGEIRFIQAPAKIHTL
jgi:hypothetical protein